MDMDLAERRQIENEMIFRRVNEKVISDLEEMDAIHLENKSPDLMWDQTILLQFQCECSNENCSSRIPLTLKEYQSIHIDRNAFLVKPNHEVKPIETVLLTKDDYSIVVKNRSTPEPGDELNKTT